MTFLEKELRIYAPARALDKVLPRRIRGNIMWMHVAAIAFLAIVLFGDVLRGGTDVLYGESRFYTVGIIILGTTFVLFFQIALFYNSLYYRGLTQVNNEELDEKEGITYEVARIVARDPHDLTGNFLQSHYGEEIMLRAGITREDMDAFLHGTREDIHRDVLPKKRGGFVTLYDMSIFLYETDSALRDFLFAHGVTEAHFIGASEWVYRVRLAHKNSTRWWGRDNLGHIQGIGRELSLGTAYMLNRFAQDIESLSAFSVYLRDTAYASTIVEKIETVLTRTKSANALLIGETGVGSMDILVEFARRIREGGTSTSLLGKRIVVFNTNLFIATYGSKQEFEGAFFTLMAEAVHAGNVVMVIENIHTFTQSLDVIGVNGADLLSAYLISSDIQLIATTLPHAYHGDIGKKSELMQFFEPVYVEVPDGTSSVRVLEEATWAMEHHYHTFFTYPALMRIVECANQYIVEGVMPDKALSLQDHVGARAGSDGVSYVSVPFVDRVVTEKTGIPIGETTKDERELLMNLEEVLEKRIVGQKRAIEVIARAMRRARTGMVSTERPMGSFLFLGSTGVGKTETAKALAHTFFGDDDHMVRLDMSEFSGVDALSRLIGGYGEVGILSSALRTHPYTVLLLDEFEKASTHVHDLFLQVLDEGMFTDGAGSVVNAKNTIIIATSNAGSELMWKLGKDGVHPEDEKERIMDSIIETHALKPELLNRFDAVVLFEILDESEQERIAELMLRGLQKRVHERGYELEVTKPLIRALVARGFTPEYGARPLRRAIQDIVEEGIARKLLAGNLKRGDTIRFTEEDLS